MSAEENWRIQIGDYGVAVWNTGQGFGNGRQHQQKRRQAEEDCFKVLGRTLKARNTPDPVSGEQQQDRCRANDIADRLMCDGKYCDSANQHRNKVDDTRP